jgi:hypothetical protein
MKSGTRGYEVASVELCNIIASADLHLTISEGL